MIPQCTWGLDENLSLTTCTRYVALTFTPSFAILLFQLLADVGVYRSHFMQALRRPFRDYMQLEDLEEFKRDGGMEIVIPGWKVTVLRVLLVLELVISIVAATLTYTREDEAKTFGWTLAFQPLTLVYFAIKILLKAPKKCPLLLTSFSILLTISTVINLWKQKSLETFIVAMVFSITATTVVVLLFTFPLQSYLSSSRTFPVDSFTPITHRFRAYQSPEEASTLWQWTTFSFVSPLLNLSGKGTLRKEDVWDLPPGFKHKNLFEKYAKRLSKANKGPHHKRESLTWFLLKSNSLDLTIDLTVEIYRSFAGFIPPYALSRTLTLLQSNEPNARRKAYIYALLTFVAHISFAQLDLWKQWYSRRCYERTRGQLFCLLHWKALQARDSNTKGEGTGIGQGKRGAGMGRISNLMSGDTYSVAQRFWDFSAVFTAPIKLTLALIFLYNVLGLASFAGIAVVLLAYLINYPLGRWNIKLTRGMWAARDERMALVNELITSIRFLKYMGWSSHWSSKVQEARDVELKWRVKQNVLGSTISFIWIWLPSCVILAAFATYTLLMKMPLTVSKAFVAIEIFSQLQGPMSQLPNEIFALLQAWVSMQRIQTYLDEEDVEDWATAIKNGKIVMKESRVGFERAIFKWNKKADSEDNGDAKQTSDFTLGPLNIDFRVGGLNLISGPIGSGKSSLLAALLGEIQTVQGVVHVDKRNHNVAFAGQQSFLEFASIRDNIVFHAPWDEKRYWDTVKACALQPDLDMLEEGDFTEVGEKGVQLSGGQRARISLARAIYSQASVVLLDDPLASVDMHTARHIFEHCLSPTAPLVKDRTIILVTHHVSLCLPATEYLVELRHGKVHRKGDVEELKHRGSLLKVIEAEDIEQVSNEEITEGEGRAVVNDADDNKPQKQRKKKVEDSETQAEGRVNYKTYLLYMKSAGWGYWLLTILLLIQIRLINVGVQFYLAKWTQSYNNTTQQLITFVQQAFEQTYISVTSLPPPSQNVTPWILIYFAISIAGALSALTYIIIGYVSSLRASRVLFSSLLSSVVGSPTRFFDISPTGRLINRFVSDVRALDDALNNSARAAISGTLQFLTSFAVIVYVVPSFTPVAIVIAVLYISIAPPFVRTARDLRRLESISLSPAFSGFSELLTGLSHVRAYGMELTYQNRFYERVDLFQSMDHAYWLAQMWLRYRYDVLGSVVVGMTTIFALSTGVDAGKAAVVIVQSGVFAEASRQLVRVLAQAELDFNAIERIKEYLELEQEAPAKRPDSHIPAAWPSTSGGIDVENLVVRYSPDLPIVLKGISFSIKPGEKVGVVGRTGSGKSTLAMALLRIVEPVSGRIMLDGVDVSTIGLDDLRNAITIISQDVSLFSGTVRSNLDPFSEHTDKEIWDILQLCHLSSPHHSQLPVSSEDAHLSTQFTQEKAYAVTSLDQPVSAGGTSFSAGERQLLALARAMLRHSGFIILDEASSSIDLKTDDQIQKTIREEMRDTLVLTIAHRLVTVADYDRILVLGSGTVLEFDTPKALYANESSIFHALCARSADWEVLNKILSSTPTQ